MNPLVHNNMPAAQADASAVRDALRNSLYPGASDSSVDMVLAYCRAAQLDPMTKPVHIVPIWVKEKKVDGRVVTPAGMRDVVMPGIELYRTKAHRTGEYAGQDDPEFGPTITETIGGVNVRYPEWCKVTVYRLVNDQRVPFPARVYWLESYATAARDSDAPNAMWKKRPFGQLEKCTEALALRKAFPEAVGAQPTAEEMEGRELDPGTSVATAGPAQARAPELPPYAEDAFKANLPAWRSAIESGKQTADQVIAKVSSKGTLTDAQKEAIRTGVLPSSGEGGAA